MAATKTIKHEIEITLDGTTYIYGEAHYNKETKRFEYSNQQTVLNRFSIWVKPTHMGVYGPTQKSQYANARFFRNGEAQIWCKPEEKEVHGEDAYYFFNLSYRISDVQNGDLFEVRVLGENGEQIDQLCINVAGDTLCIDAWEDTPINKTINIRKAMEGKRPPQQ